MIKELLNKFFKKKDPVETLIWDNKFNTGIKKIDKQHKKLFNLVNNFKNPKLTNKKNIDSTINELLIYVRVHFSTEEEYFKKYNYKFAKEHIKEHIGYTNKTLKFKERFDNGEDIIGEFLNFMNVWWSNHVLVEDMKYVPTFKKFNVGKK